MILAYRRLNQRIRRWFFSLDTPWRRRLYDRKRELVASKSFSLVFVPLTPEVQDQLEAINWTLGNGYIFKGEK